MSRPHSTGKITPWTKEEDRKLIRLGEDGVTIFSMASSMKRTPYAISARITSLRKKGVLRSHKPIGFHGVKTYGTRHCHDCGKPTPNYRCTECWRKLRERLGLEQVEFDDKEEI